MVLLQDTPIELIIAGVKPMKSHLKNVKYIGYINDVNELMWAADVLVHPAKYEAYAQVVSEALLCGLPVIVSDRVGAKSVVNMNVGRVVSGFEHQDWVNTIKNVLDTEWSIDPDFAEKHSLSVENHCEQILLYGTEIKKL
jgi:glycosyltransferase involved in cell wall biosynthesis